MRILLALQSLVLIPSVLSTASSSEGVLVVVNSGEDTIALVNPEHPEVINKITTHKHPQDIIISRDGSLAYVAEMGTMEAPGNTVVRPVAMVQRA